MPLKVVVIGCEHSQGISKADKPYDFANCNYLAPNEGWSSDKGRCNAVGLNQKQITMSTSEQLIAKFNTLSEEFPLMCELTLDADPQNPARNIVVDIKPIKG